ncbi:unnamed protein product, partial [Symbiodinium necroappetens]
MSAFDVMPRSKLQEAMDLAKVDPAAQHVILQLHAHASLRVTHGSQVAMLDTDNGIRQGCCLAPSLWVLYTGLILTYIRQQVSMHDSTVFVDDFLFHWLVASTDQLKGAFRNIAFVLDTLEAFGMTISPGKSAVLIGVRGSKVGSILQKHVFKDPRKGKFLHCATRHGTIRLPVVTQHPYLGAILSYQSMEALTLKERIRQSWSSFHRILPALRSNSVALRSRISVWQSCVFSTLMHGLDSMGLAPGGSTLLYKHVVRQLRLVCKAPSYITHEEPADLLTRLRVQDPTDTLRLRVQRRLSRCREGHMAVLQPPLVHSWWQQLDSNLQSAASDPKQMLHQHPLRDIPSTSMAPANPTNLLVDRIVNRYPCLPRDWCATALARDWKRLALNIKSTDFNHCLLCGQWLAHPGYLSRHVKSQHAEAYAFHAAVLKWLDDHKTAILSPCQFCGADFKVFYSDCAPLMHRLLPLLHLPPQAMETHMKDALRKEMAEVETQELMGAQDQANLLSAMMRRSAGALEPSAPSDPGLGSTPGRAGSHGDAEGQTDGGERSPSRQGQRRPGEVAQALRQGKCQDIRRWLAAGSQLPGTQQAPNDPEQALLNLCLSMGRLLLRHEDQFGINRAQDTYVMFAQCQGVLSMVPELYVAAEAWKTMKKETPELLTLPLRAWLLKHWVDLMLKRMEMIMMSEDTIKQVLEALKSMQLLAIQPLVVLRFH